MSISVIVPTLGRPTLERTIGSLKLRSDDEVIVIADDRGNVSYAQEIVEEMRNAKFATVRNNDGIACNHRNRGMLMSTKTHICFLDDDDVHTSSAMVSFRKHACDVPVIFKMYSDRDGMLWKDEQIRFCNVGTPMFLVPNKREKLGWWRPVKGATGFHPTSKNPVESGSDFMFIQETAINMGGVRWSKEVVALIGASNTSEIPSLAS